MSPISNPSIIFNELPKGEPTLETLKIDESAQIDLEEELKDNEIILKLVCVSLDPYMRGRMREEHIKSYSPAFPLNKPIGGHGVAKVVKSKSNRYEEGVHIYGVLPYTTYIRRTAPTEEEDAQNAKFFGGPALKILKNEENLSWSTYIGAAGMPGKTAYMAWKEYSPVQGHIGQAKVAYISAGSGPVGSLAIQMAKKDGYKVIASAGSDKKIQFCKDIGADVVFNYKTDNPDEIFAKEAPEGIDVNWVNVGGKAFETELAHSASHGRVIVCGWISAYNGKSDGITNLFQIVAKRLHVNGFIVGDLEPKYGSEFYSTVPKALASGEVKFSEVKYDGLDKIPQAFIDLLAGKQGGGDGLGKVVIEIK